ncbi:MAG: helix-turn-helix domain-containing protein [Jiangellaceae bacterium]
MESETRSRQAGPEVEELKFLTTSDLAAIIHRPESTLRYWRARGEGPKGIRVGGTYLYPEKRVREWLAALDVDGALA